MSFPRNKYIALIASLFPVGSTVFWNGTTEPYFEPLPEFDTPIIVKLDVGDSYGYGTSESRVTWNPNAEGGRGANEVYTLQRMTWPLTIDVETFNPSHPGEDFIMRVRNKIRWASSILAIQNMGLTTVHVGNVNSELRVTDSRTSFGAVLKISHGQCYALTEDDNTGNVIETIASLPGTLTGGVPSPVAIEEGPISVP